VFVRIQIAAAWLMHSQASETREGAGSMKKITLFSALLVAGLLGSQLLPAWLGPAYAAVAETVLFLTMLGLAFT